MTKADIYANFTEPINDLHIHVVLYYKYKYYQKYAIDLWEDLCGWMNKTKRSILLDYTFGLKTMMPHLNLNQSCPISYFRFMGERLERDTLDFQPPLPSGRYRIDINVTGKSRDDNSFWVQFWFSISDHRIEVY